MLLEKREEIPSEAMKRLSQSRYSQCPVVDVSGGENKAWCCKEQYCIATWKVRSTSQGKLEMARMNINILGISELKWTAMGEFNSDDNYICYCGQECLRNGVALIINKRGWNVVLGCNLKNERTISVLFQGKSYRITVIQVYAPTANTKEAEVERF